MSRGPTKARHGAGCALIETCAVLPVPEASAAARRCAIVLRSVVAGAAIAAPDEFAGPARRMKRATARRRAAAQCCEPCFATRLLKSAAMNKVYYALSKYERCGLTSCKPRRAVTLLLLFASVLHR